jgi:cephalosporin-C deacetylase-like acetyl esterase
VGLSIHAQESPLKISLDVNDVDGILHDQNTMQAFLIVENESDEQIKVRTHWQILTDDWQPLKTVQLIRSIKPNEILRMNCPLFRFPAPGFYRITASVEVAGYPDQTFQQVVGMDPEKLSQPIDRKADFGQFWDKALEDLAAIPPKYKLTAVNRQHAKTDLFKVDMQSYGDKTVRGWLEVPKKQGVYPTLLRVPGYTENMEPIDEADDMIVFSFNTRDHGASDDSDGKGTRSWDMWVRGLDSIDDYYYKGLFLDCIRAMDFLETRKDVDQDRIAIWGGSQGGGLSFSTAALDRRVDLCIADIPYMCEYPTYFEITHWDEMDNWFMDHPATTWESVLHTLSYYDTKNLTDKIECPVWMGVGLQDDVCPPSTSFVAYNNIKSDKSYVVYKYEKHNQPPRHYENRFEQLRAFFEMENK